MNVCEPVSCCANWPVSNDSGPDVLVAVCGIASMFVQRTVSPTRIVSALGANADPEIETSTVRGAGVKVGVGAGLVGVEVGLGRCVGTRVEVAVAVGLAVAVGDGLGVSVVVAVGRLTRGEVEVVPSQATRTAGRKRASVTSQRLR